jgi:hypothetical protein
MHARVIEKDPQDYTGMELLLQALDELDDLISSVRQLWLPYQRTQRTQRHPRQTAPTLLRVAASSRT